MAGATRFLRINGVTTVSLPTAVTQARDVIQSAGGWITGFQQYSNISVCVSFQIEACDVPALMEGLSSAPIHFSLEDRNFADAELQGTLQITFFRDEPELKLPVPAVPG